MSNNVKNKSQQFYKSYSIILLLSFVSGILDFYMLKNYSIFVTTQTGNLVYFGLSLLNGQLNENGFVYSFYNSYLYLIPFLVIVVFSLIFSFIDKKSNPIILIYSLFILEIIYFILWAIFADDINLYVGTNNKINPIAIIITVFSTIFVSFHLTIFNQDNNIVYASVISMGDIINASRSLYEFFISKKRANLIIFFRYMLIIFSFIIAVLFSYIFDKYLNFRALYLIPLFLFFCVATLLFNHFNKTRYFIEL